jgi:broad specificity phosphatase PhoE
MSETNYTTFYIVRHGQSHGNINPHDSNPDPELTDDGRKQVEEVAQKLSSLSFDLIAHSDYKRAVQTAQILNSYRNLNTEMYEILRERNFGSFYQREQAEVERMLNSFRTILDQLGDDEYWDYKHIPDMESEREALDRFILAINTLTTKHSGKKILVVGHGNLMRSFLTHLGYAHFTELPPMSFANAGYISVRTDGKQFFLDEVVGATLRNVKKSPNLQNLRKVV